MADLVNPNAVSIDSIRANIERFKFNPVSIQRNMFDVLDEISSGRITVMDATSPFVFSLSAQAVNMSVLAQEMQAVTRKLYPALNQLDDDLYLHMSDVDYINRFAVPLDTDFTFMVPLKDIQTKMVLDATENAYKAIIPRDTGITIGDLVFTLQYPVVIRLYTNGSIKVTFDTEIPSPLRTLQSNVIASEKRRLPDGTDVLMFNVPTKQYGIRSIAEPIAKGTFFNKEVQFVDQFYYARVFYRNNGTGTQWVEMKTTHTDQVYDIQVPTALLQVLQSSVKVVVPPVYVNSGLISGEIRVDVYSTKGQVTINMSNYQMSSFVTKFAAIDTDRDANAYTAAMATISALAYSADTVSGGRSALSYEDLRTRVMNNTTGPNEEPITDVSLEALVGDAGFELIKRVDLVTNRIYLAAKDLPKPINADLLTSANFGMMGYINSVDALKQLDTVVDNGDRVTIMSNNLFENVNGIVNILTPAQIAALKSLPSTSLVTQVNSRNFLYTPFYYVLDNSDSEFSVRPYHLDKPDVHSFNFVSQNETLELGVNTGVYEFKKVATGYELWVMTKSDSQYQQLPDGMVQLQLAVIPDGETTYAYLNGEYQFTTSEGERAYKFSLITNHDIDSEDLITLTNFSMFVSNNPNIKVKLTDGFHLFYTTTSISADYRASEADQLIGHFLLPNNAAVITHELFTLQMGEALKNLWARCRTLATGLDYERYEDDVPLMYTERVYQKDPTTGSIITGFDGDNKPEYTVLHEIGDPVLDNGQQVYKHRKGDAVLDGQGNPVIISELSTTKEFDLLMIDGKYFFATDNSFVNYRTELVSVVRDWIIDDLQDVQNVLLEQTRIYFYPKTTIGTVKAVANGSSVQRLDAEQSLSLTLYVSDAVHKSEAIRDQITKAAAVLLDEALALAMININAIEKQLASTFGSSVQALKLAGLGGDANYTLITVENEHNRLCLGKKLEVQPDETFIIVEAIDVEFVNLG